MANTTVTIVVTTTGGNPAFAAQADVLSPKESLVRVAQYMDKLALGCNNSGASVNIQTGGTQATGTITLSSFAAADTLTVGTQVFTASASPSGNNQFLSTGGDTTVAAAATAKINAHPSLVNVVTATSASGVITVTAASAGLTGNTVQLAISAHGTVSAAHLAGGVNATSHVMHAGL